MSEASGTTVAAGHGELLCVSADDRAALVGEVSRLIDRLERGPSVEPTDLAAELDRGPRGRHRLAVLGDGPAGLSASLRKARERLADGARDSIRLRGTVYYSSLTDPGRTAFLFPGQGSQFPGMLRRLAADRPGVRDWFDALDAAYRRGGSELLPSRLLAPADEPCPGRDRALVDMEYGGQLGLVASLALFEVLEDLGVHPDVIVGHSNGEHAALTAGGLLVHDGRDALCDYLYRVGQAGQCLAPPPVPEGMLAVAGLRRETSDAVLEGRGGSLFLAMDNCPGQCVLAGTSASLEMIRGPIEAEGGACVRLPFERAYHTPMFADWSRLLRECYEGVRAGTPRAPVFSCMTCEPFPDDRERILDQTAEQWSSPVRFRQTIERLYADGVRTFVEVGPDEKLSAFVADTLRGRPHLAVSASSRFRDDLAQLRLLAAELYVRGLPVRIGRREVPSDGRAPKGVAGHPTTTVAVPANGRDLTTSAVRRLLAEHAALRDEAAASHRRVLARLGRIPPASVEVGVTRPAAIAAIPTRPRHGGLLDDVRIEGPRLIARRRFDRLRDRFVDDHSLGRLASSRRPGRFPLPVLAFTLSMAIAAEAAGRLLGGRVVVGLSGVRARRWLALDRGRLDLEIRAERRGAVGHGDELVWVRIDEATATHGPPAFEATVRLADSYPVAPPPRPASGPPAAGSWTAEDFYGRFAFHGPGFRPLRRVEAARDEVAAELESPALPGLESEGLALDPATLDGTGQLVALRLLEQGYRDFGIFPFAADALTLYGPPSPPGHRLRLRGQTRLDAAGWTEASLDLIDPDGRPMARLEGLRQRLVRFPSAFARIMLGGDPESAFLGRVRSAGPGLAVCRLRPADWGLLAESGAIWSRVLAHLTLAPPELDAWYDAGGRGTPAIDRLLERVAAKEAARALLAGSGLRLASADLTIDDGPDGMIARAPELGRDAPRLRVDRRGDRIVAAADRHEADGGERVRRSRTFARTLEFGSGR